MPTKRKIIPGRHRNNNRKDLSHKQKEFCKEYVRNKGIGVQAALKANYGGQNNATTKYEIAKNEACRLLKKDKIKEEIRELTDHYDLNKDWITKEHLRNYKKNDTSQHLKYNHLTKLGEIVGCYKNEQITQTGQINVTNILNYVNKSVEIKENKERKEFEVKEIKEQENDPQN